MKLEEVIAGCEEAWEFFGGVFRVVVPDNMSPVVADADAVNPRLTREWLEYAQARGFVTDPARVRHRRGNLPGPGGCAVEDGRLAGGGERPGARQHPAGARGGVRRAGGAVPAACPRGAVPGAVLGAGQSPRRLPHSGRPGAVFGAVAA